MTGKIRNYKETLNLPQTDFPMKASLPKREPDILSKWKEMRLYQQLRESSIGREKYVLHDGPPYANGDIHIGHALNKILKDIITRSQQMMGKDAAYIPGWDCHGLPIEWKIEEQYRQKGLDKDHVPPTEFRAECRHFAQKWMEIQSQQFQRLGIIGDWENPYTTMSYEAESTIVEEFLKFAMNGSLYRGSKPVMWSVVEKTALAEAEVEYEDHISTTLFVKFPIKKMMNIPENTHVIIWTTTPWTIPANRAIAYSKQLSYGIYMANGEHLIICDTLAPHVMQVAKIEKYHRKCDIDLADIATCAHPFAGQGYDFDVPILAGDFVSDETGTGLVHIAPSHGHDDFELSQKHHLDIPFIVDESGTYYDHIPLFAGHFIFTHQGKEGNANKAVIAALIECNQLFAQGKYRHQYPHSWRSKAPLILRNTPQWFISMQKHDLRSKALREVENVQWIPPTGRNRISTMIQNRPDWVVSRQRAWGVPLTIFVNKKNGQILQDIQVNTRIIKAICEKGADVWFERDPQIFLGENYQKDDYEQITDILDVWFDSGVTHSFVLEKRADLQFPADLYLEGSDQHRGWFQSSLLTSCGIHNQAPYKAVLTHGFTMDAQGRKMSKSSKNVIDPQKIIQQVGADIIRLWTVSCNYADDQRIGQEIIKANTESYRKMRNTLRFILGNLNGYNMREQVEIQNMPELEQFILHKLHRLDILIRENYNTFNLRKLYQELFHFMAVDLSSFYFDIRKDTLYCDAPSNLERQSCRTVLHEIFQCLTAWLAPILCFTMEEVWQTYYDSTEIPYDSVHLRPFPQIPDIWKNDALADKWDKIRTIRRVVTGALEIQRKEKYIGSSLESAPLVYIENKELHAVIKNINMADICITSQIKIIEERPPDHSFKIDDIDGIGVLHMPAQGKKCQRSWKILPEVGSNPDYPDLTPRDAEVVKEHDQHV